MDLPDKALTSALFFFLFPEKSRTCGDKGVAGFQRWRVYYMQITACIRKESRRSEKRQGHQKRAKRGGKDDQVSMAIIQGWWKYHSHRRLYSWLFNLLTVGPGVSVSSSKDGSWMRLPLKKPSSLKILFVLPHSLGPRSWRCFLQSAPGSQGCWRALIVGIPWLSAFSVQWDFRYFNFFSAVTHFPIYFQEKPRVWVQRVCKWEVNQALKAVGPGGRSDTSRQAATGSRQAANRYQWSWGHRDWDAGRQ